MSTAAPTKPRIAFYAPMKSPNHATPSGDRRIARLTLAALRLAGFDPFVVSDLRTLDMQGDASTQEGLHAQATAEQTQLRSALQDAPPALWFTYHCHYKAPDLLGPQLSDTLGIPYAISEPSISPKRRTGPWAGFAKRSEAAIARADRLFWTTARDRPALEDAGHNPRMTHLPAFVETPAARPMQPAPHAPLRLLTVAMMRPGDKLESYRRLANALQFLELDWYLTIIGDGSARSDVEAVFAKHTDRVTFKGQIDCRQHLNDVFSAADLFLWPGVGEGVGMVYLEAQAAGLPVVAEDHPASTELVAGPCVPENNPKAFADRIAQLADRTTYSAVSQKAQAHIHARHSLDAAAATLRQTLEPLLT